MSSNQNHLSGDHIDYNRLIHHALLSAVRELLTDAAAHGLRGDHHFYLAFNTTHPGVLIPDYIRAQHPEEMTIVLQNQFWDLTVSDDVFSVKLSFNSKPEELVIPFDALIGFLDPSVQFALQFKDDEPESAEHSANTQEPDASTPAATESHSDAPEDEQPEDDQGENVVALDAFRK